MQIKTMFEKPIDRKIKGVIKVGQKDEENIYQELDEYVVTDELQKHFREFFHVYNKRERSIDTSRLAGIEMTNEQFFSEIRSDNYSVVYTLKDKLAQRYELREHETIILNDRENGKLTISNKGENKEVLFARLLRYDTSCEIETPKVYREEMKNLLDEMLKNYQ